MLGECKGCVVYKEQVRHLQGLLDQTLGLIAPKTSEPIDPPPEPEDKDVERFGEP